MAFPFAFSVEHSERPAVYFDMGFDVDFPPGGVAASVDAAESKLVDSKLKMSAREFSTEDKFAEQEYGYCWSPRQLASPQGVFLAEATAYDSSTAFTRSEFPDQDHAYIWPSSRSPSPVGSPRVKAAGDSISAKMASAEISTKVFPAATPEEFSKDDHAYVWPLRQPQGVALVGAAGDNFEVKNDAPKVSRQVSSCGTESEFSDEGFSSLCTEDVCPSMTESPVSELSEPRFINRTIYLKLWEAPTITRAVLIEATDMLVDLKDAINEATGTNPSGLHFFMEGTGCALMDRELIPSRVLVRGIDRLPKGKVLLGRKLFLPMVTEVKCALAGVGAKLPSLSTAEELLPMESSFRTAFGSLEEMNAFYRSSRFMTDPDFQELYHEINALMDSDGTLPFEFVGAEEEQKLIAGG